MRTRKTKLVQRGTLWGTPEPTRPDQESIRDRGVFPSPTSRPRHRKAGNREKSNRLYQEDVYLLWGERFDKRGTQLLTELGKWRRRCQ